MNEPLLRELLETVHYAGPDGLDTLDWDPEETGEDPDDEEIEEEPGDAPEQEKGSGTCQQGETAAATGCTPASGNGAKKPSRGSEKPSEAHNGFHQRASVSMQRGIAQAAARFTDAKLTAKRFAQAGYDHLPQKVQRVVDQTFGVARYVEHKVMTGFRASRKLAEQIAQERGLDKEQAEKLGRVLATIDTITAWTVNMPAALAVTGNPAVAKVAAWVPVASLSYVAYSTARNPFATLRAAKALVKGEKKAYTRKQLDKDLAGELADRILKGGDWYLALFSAALDLTPSDPYEAMSQADEWFKNNPEAPQGEEITESDLEVLR